MIKKMSPMGIGPKAGIVVGGYLAVTGLISYLTRPLFTITDQGYGILLAVGIALAVVGFSMNLLASLQMLKAYKADTLATKGLYGIFLHPMYFFQVFMTLPGIALITNSYLVLTLVPVAAVVVRLFSKQENEYLKTRYGAAYEAYRTKVPVRY
jgi:protein-S-isoprenylcysteine O-methyltransferase Ste14